MTKNTRKATKTSLFVLEMAIMAISLCGQSGLGPTVPITCKSTSPQIFVQQTGSVNLKFFACNGSRYIWFWSAPRFVGNEIPVGTADNKNLVFKLANAPSPTASVELVVNGFVLMQGADYTVSGNTLTLNPNTILPNPNCNFHVSYRY